MPHRGNTFLTLLEIWCPLPSASTRGSLSFSLGLWSSIQSHPPHGRPFHRAWALIPHTGPSCCSSNPPGHLSCSTSPKELHWSGRKGEVIKGEEEELYTWFCCLYCTSVCGFATLDSLSVFIKWFKEFRNYITTTILRIILNGFIFFFTLLKKSIFRSRLGEGQVRDSNWMNEWMDGCMDTLTDRTDR